MQWDQGITQETASRSQYLWAAGTGLVLGSAFGAFAKQPHTAAEVDQLIGIGKGGAVYADQTYLNSIGRSDQKDSLKDILEGHRSGHVPARRLDELLPKHQITAGKLASGPNQAPKRRG